MSELEGRELGFDDEIVEDGKDFQLIPAGDYSFTIDHYERGRSSGAGKLPPCNMVTVYFLVEDRDRTVQIRDNFLLYSTLEWKLSELFRSVGMKKEGEKIRMRWDDLPGKKGRCKVSLVDGIKDPSKKFNQIDKLYPLEAPKYTPGKF